MKKLANINKISLIAIIVLIWQLLIYFKVVPTFLLPSPLQVVMAFKNDFLLLMYHTKFTLMVAFFGVLIGTVLAFLLSVTMDNSAKLYEATYPVLVITQTIPTVAIAPLLVIWFGYYFTPKIILVTLTSFFPITIALLDGYKSVDADSIRLLKAMGATKVQIYKHLKVPASMQYFFAGLKVSLSYALIAAVISEWLGGFYGLGVYMTRVKKAYALDKMFAVIILITCLSLLLISLVKFMERKLVKS